MQQSNRNFIRLIFCDFVAYALTSNESTPMNQSGEGTMRVISETRLWLLSTNTFASLRPAPIGIAGMLNSSNTLRSAVVVPVPPLPPLPPVGVAVDAAVALKLVVPLLIPPDGDLPACICDCSCIWTCCCSPALLSSRSVRPDSANCLTAAVAGCPMWYSA